MRKAVNAEVWEKVQEEVLVKVREAAVLSLDWVAPRAGRGDSL